MSDSNSQKTQPDIDVTRDIGSVGNSEDGDFEVSTSSEELVLPTEIGDYTVHRLIGAGGMGRVYEAEHRRMARIVALKMLPHNRMQDQKAVERFYAEVRATARLLHPNIVTAFDAGNVGDLNYLAMEYVEGHTLTSLVVKKGPLKLKNAVRVIKQAATGLQHAHIAGIVHRDVKPSNLMVTNDGVVKVLDLGLATIGSELTNLRKKGRLVGTIEYMPPEQIEDPSQPDRRNDIYSLGGTFFYLLTGRTPFSGDVLEQARAHRESPLPSIFELRPDVDVRLDAIIRRMMAKRLEDRYSSLSEVIEDLNEWSANATASDFTGSGINLILPGDRPTEGVDPTTATGRSSVLGLDVGMFYVAAATVEAGGPIQVSTPTEDAHALLHTAVATRDEKMIFGTEAIELRTKQPHRLAHCVQLYLGQSRLDRNLGDRQCPPEAALALIMRHAGQNSWNLKGRPAVVAVTIPACYDQAHRRSIMQAAQIAGFPSVRLIDRPLAAAQSQLTDEFAAAEPPEASDVRHWMVVSVTGLAMEVSIIRHVAGRLQTLSNIGDWNLGVLAWQRRVVDLAATDCLRRLGSDPRKDLKDAVSLQLACEKAIRQLSIKTKADLDFRLRGRDATVTLKRESFGAACSELLVHLKSMIQQAISNAGIADTEVDHCLQVGNLSRLAPVTDVIRGEFTNDVEMIPVDRAALAGGAASAVMGELPGQDNAFPAPHSCSSYDLGVLVSDEKTRTRTVPVVPSSTTLPARTTRRLWQPKEGRKSLTIIESAGRKGEAWRSLGACKLPEHNQETPLEAVFEVDLNGLLKVRIRNPETGESQRVSAMPTPVVSESQLATWRDWVEEYIPPKIV